MAAVAIAASLVVQSAPSFAGPATTWSPGATSGSTTVGNCTIGGYSSRWFGWMPCISF
jgi:hypothetical protein